MLQLYRLLFDYLTMCARDRLSYLLLPSLEERQEAYKKEMQLVEQKRLDAVYGTFVFLTSKFAWWFGNGFPKALRCLNLFVIICDLTGSPGWRVKFMGVERNVWVRLCYSCNHRNCKEMRRTTDLQPPGNWLTIRRYRMQPVVHVSEWCFSWGEG